MPPKQAPTLELVEDLIEVQAIAQKWATRIDIQKQDPLAREC